ncbi:MAG: hypothetical protein IJS61_06360 [Firmicutes bacterium]|nr:hypothetical protein [Bacillota bacterium]
MAKKNTNENYIHSCDSDKVRIEDNICSILNMGYSHEQAMNILNFYVFNAPILHSNKNDSPFGLKTLKSYGWIGNELSKLEGRLLKTAGIGNFIFIKCNTIENTLENMDLHQKICIEHPRAVLKQNFKPKIEENGIVQLLPCETRMECLFRHIRNSIAHNHTYLFENNNILLEDRDENETISALILIPKQALIDWINVVDNKICNKIEN